MALTDRAAAAALALGAGSLLAACGGDAAPSASTSARPTPVVTPDPHLTSPALADDVWRALSRGGLRIVAKDPFLVGLILLAQTLTRPLRRLRQTSSLPVIQASPLALSSWLAAVFSGPGAPRRIGCPACSETSSPCP